MPPDLCLLSYGEDGGLQPCSPPGPLDVPMIIQIFLLSLEPEVNEGSERTD
jgi:hypothetical protein